MILSLPNIKGEANGITRCELAAQYYYNAVQLTGGSHHGASQVEAAKYEVLVDNFIAHRRYGVCVDPSTPGCARVPQILHRLSLTCDGGPVADESTVDLRTGYDNYRCTSRYQPQCVDDETRDGFYMEWCEYSGSTCTAPSANQLACGPGATPAGRTCRPTTLHRSTYSCDGTLRTPETTVDLTTGYGNYTCSNRFRDQCVVDGTWDGYYSEWCEYTCT